MIEEPRHDLLGGEMIEHPFVRDAGQRLPNEIMTAALLVEIEERPRVRLDHRIADADVEAHAVLA